MSNIYKCVQLTSNANYHDLLNDFKIDRESKYSSIKDKIVGLCMLPVMNISSHTMNEFLVFRR